MFEKIVVAINDSPSSPVALSFVAALARQQQASIHVLAVNELRPGGRGQAELTDTAAARLVEGAVRELRGCGIEVSGSVDRATTYYVARTIANVAAGRGADVIVIGSKRHRRGIGQWISHRLRDRIIASTSLPVLVAPATLGPSRRDASYLELLSDTA